MERKILWVGLGLFVLVMAVAIIMQVGKQQSFNGVVIDPAPDAPALVLTDQHGQEFSMAAQKGKIVLVYFGYTNCPDYCPITMAKMRQVFDQLGEKADNVRVIMVTTDPVRDTPEQLGNYLSNFHPAFLGLTGDDAALQQVYKAYGVSVADSGTTHSTRTYVIDQTGKFRLTFPYEMEVAAMTADIEALLKGK